MLPNTVSTLNKWPKIFIFRHLGEIWPNMATLFVVYTPTPTPRYLYEKLNNAFLSLIFPKQFLISLSYSLSSL